MTKPFSVGRGEGWKEGGMEEGRDGRREGWKEGGMEGGRGGRGRGEEQAE